MVCHERVAVWQPGGGALGAEVLEACRPFLVGWFCI